MLSNNMNTVKSDNYDSKVHVVGRVTLIIGFILTFLPPIILWVAHGIIPPGKNLLNGMISISTIMAPVSLIEVLTFTPVLGASAMYMAYLTGNLSNMKIPSAAISMEVADVKPSTKEGDIISTIAIAGSVIASEIVIVMGVVLIAPLSSKLNNPVIQPAFQQILPALFGSIGAYYILKEWKLAVVPLLAGIILNLIGGLPTALTIPVCVGTSVLAARILYKIGLIKSEGTSDKMSLKIFLINILLHIIGFIKGEKYRYSQEYEDNFKYMDTGEKLWWAYKSLVRQIERGEKGKGIEEYFANQDLNFKVGDGFEEASRMVITSGGDLNASDMIFPENTQHLWDDVKEFFFSGDIICANLETPLDPSRPPAGVPPMCLTAPKLNTTPEMFDRFALDGNGINFYATANNHSLDQGESGLIATLDFLDSKEYRHTGTSRTKEEQMDIPVIEVNGIRTAMLSYTYCLNGADPIVGKEYMTNVIRLNKPDTDITLINEHVRIAREKGADIVIAHLHWSVEFETYPIENIIKMGHRIIECGVDIILGGHPHVAQPMEKYSYYDSNSGIQRTGFIIYSFGELVSLNYFSKNSRLAFLLKIEIVKGRLSGESVTKIADLKVLPIHICFRKFKDGTSDYRVLDFIKTIKQLDNGENPYGFSEKEIIELKRLERLLYDRLLPRNIQGIL